MVPRTQEEIMANPIFRVSVTELRPGMTVYKENDKGKLIPDVYLSDYFLSGYPPREFIYGHRLQFKTGGGQVIVWRNAGHVYVSHGNATRK
jgi:hypothetical protein